jgi:hypothetical protein
MRTSLALTLAFALGAAFPIAIAQTLPPPPSGFQSTANRASGGNAVEATKANDTMSDCFGDPKIHFAYSWILNPMAKNYVEMLAKVPADPASTRSMGGYLDEPVSKEAYKGGVLEWRRQTWPVIAGHPCKDKEVVFYNAVWTGYVSDKLIGMSVDHLYNSKGQGQAWIDEYIEKLKGALNTK